MKDNLITGAAIVAIVLSGLAFFNGGTDGIDGRDGRVVGGSGPDQTNQWKFYEGITVGHDVKATSTASGVSSITTTGNVINCDNPYISWTANLDQTVTTQASTTAPFSQLRAGESCSIIVYSATTTAATTITWAAGTGVDLQEDEGETVIQNGLEAARLTFTKKADKDILMIVEVFQVGD